jgi:anti-sigma factor RsiW
MNCEDVRTQLHDFTRGRLDPARDAEIGSHVEGCASCASAERAEHALDELLEQRLPRYAAPPALKRRLGLLVNRPAPEREPLPAPKPLPLPAPRAARRWMRIAAPALAAGLALAVGGVLLQRGPGRDGALASLGSEAVNDHLRVLASQHPVDVESGGTHQVKPWFEGKLDFAPAVPALEGTDVRLRGGAVGYVFDRKAAVLVYGLRLHLLTLLVFRAEGLPWPEGDARPLGPVRALETSTRGFNTVLWRADGLGYALVSDVNAKELAEVAARMAAETAR